MATEPLGNTFITVTFELDANAEKIMIKNIKQVTKKISKQMKQQISKDVAEGIEQGAEQGGKKIKGRMGFAGGGVLAPFRPEVMLAYTGARYMHMLLTRLVFNPIEDSISYYFNRKKMGFETQGVKPTEETLKDLQTMRDVLPSITAKLGLFLQEVSKGTKIDAVDLVEELKKMIDQGKARDATEAFQKYRGILSMPENARKNALMEFGGSLSLAENLRYGNVTPNLLNYLNSKEFEKYATSFENMLKDQKGKELVEYGMKAQAIRSGITEMVVEDFREKIEKEITALERENRLALGYLKDWTYGFRRLDLKQIDFGAERLEKMDEVADKMGYIEPTSVKDVFNALTKGVGEIINYLKTISDNAKKKDAREQFFDNTN